MHKQSTVVFISCLIVTSLVGCATSLQTGSHCTVEDRFLDSQATYSWHEGQAVTLVDETGYVSPTIMAQLELAVRQQLQSKGLEYERAASTNDQPDLTIAVNLRIRRELYSVNSATSTCADESCGERIDMGANTRMDLRTSGFLSADAYYKDEPIWRGWAERWLYPSDRDNALEVIGEALPALFETFPRDPGN